MNEKSNFGIAVWQSERFSLFSFQIVEYAYKNNLAAWYPEPKDKEAFLHAQMYSPDYDSFAFDSYEWPKDAMEIQKV